MRQARNDYDAVEVHSHLTLKPRDPSQLRSRRSSTSSAAESIFDDVASISSQASADTSYSLPPVDHGDPSDLDSIIEHEDLDWLHVQENRQLQAELLHLNVVHIDDIDSSSALLAEANSIAKTVTNSISSVAAQSSIQCRDAASSAQLHDVPEDGHPRCEFVGQPDASFSALTGRPLPLRVKDGPSQGPSNFPPHIQRCPLPSLSAGADCATGFPLGKDPLQFEVSKTNQDGSAPRKCHPRRSAPDASRTPPSLLRQEERKMVYVEQLIDITEQLIAVIWPSSRKIVNVGASTGSSAICLRYFLREVLKRSRASHSTLQVALYYCFLVWKSGNLEALDGRRMFLSSLMLAYKYLQDRNYSTHAWHSISSLPINEIKKIEMVFMQAVDYRLFIRNDDWLAWRSLIDASIFDASHGVTCNAQHLLQKMARFQATPKPSVPDCALGVAAPTPQFEQTSEIQTTPPRTLLPARQTFTLDQQSGFISPESLPDIAEESPTAGNGIDDAHTMPSAPRETPLSSPESASDEPSYHPHNRLGRELHNPRGNIGQILAAVSTSTEELQSTASVTCSSTVQDISGVLRTGQVMPAYSDKTNCYVSDATSCTDYDGATTPSFKESPRAESPSSDTWVESHIDPYEAFTEEADRMADALYAKNRTTSHIRRKRSIGKTFTAGSENLPRNARHKMCRYRH